MKQNLTRFSDSELSSHFSKYKEILVLLGARQVGKTTELQKLFPQAEYFSVDNHSIKSALERYDISSYRQLFPQTDHPIVLDEIHQLSDPGRAAKILYDHIPGIQLILTGSSAFTIKRRTGESLAGRKIDYHLYPLTFSEYLVQQGITADLSDHSFTELWGTLVPNERIVPFDRQGILETVLRYGTYPAMLSHPVDGRYLTTLLDSVIFRDIVDMQLIDNKEAARDLLKLLAYQIGQTVNISELAGKLGISASTVKRYISIFEQSFIIFTVSPYTKNGRREIGKMPKIYFWDTGLRNAVIDAFGPIRGRGDVGQLFENFLMAEWKKLNEYGHFGWTFHYWRTIQGAEVDCVMARGDDLVAIEIKYSGGKMNRAFCARYPKALTRIITSKNFY